MVLAVPKWHFYSGTADIRMGVVWMQHLNTYAGTAYFTILIFLFVNMAFELVVSYHQHVPGH